MQIPKFQNYFTIATFKQLKHLRFTSMKRDLSNLQMHQMSMHKKRSHSATKECKTKQLTDYDKKSMRYEKNTSAIFFISKQAIKQADRTGKLDQSLQKPICKFQQEKPLKTLWI